jgi:uncharacterized protein (DUF1810 family)
MKILTPEIQQEAILLINQLRSGTLNDEELSDIVTKLRSLLPDPYFMAYAIDVVPELSAEDVVRRAFEYKPIQL